MDLSWLYMGLCRSKCLMFGFMGFGTRKENQEPKKKKKKKKKLNREYKLKFLVRKEKFFMHSCVIFSFFYFSSHGLALRFFSSLFQIFKLHTY